jgi:hypothetical protein
MLPTGNVGEYYSIYSQAVLRLYWPTEGAANLSGCDMRSHSTVALALARQGSESVE